MARCNNNCHRVTTNLQLNALLLLLLLLVVVVVVEVVVLVVVVLNMEFLKLGAVSGNAAGPSAMIKLLFLEGSSRVGAFPDSCLRPEVGPASLNTVLVFCFRQ